jgi:hypothetical protein
LEVIIHIDDPKTYTKLKLIADLEQRRKRARSFDFILGFQGLSAENCARPQDRRMVCAAAKLHKP